LKKTLGGGKTSHVHGQAELILEDRKITKKSFIDSMHTLSKIILKFIWKHKNPKWLK
jgi:hypothetical protein